MRTLLVLLISLTAFGTGAQAAETGMIEPRWRVVFDDREGPAIAVLRRRAGGGIEGTVMTPTGDDGLLVGSFESGELALHPADGSAGPVYRATRQDDGSLRGTLTWGSGKTDGFVAVASPEARLPDLYALTRWNEGVEPGSLVFRDVKGTERSLADVAPGPAIVYIMGTWCHNCSDATRLLNELHAAYAERGLDVVGLAFEAPAGFEQQADAVRRYQDSKRVPFPILIAGQRDKADATRVLGALDRVRAYPTFAFVDRAGKVAAVHQGFIGPAAPDAHAALRASFVEQIEALLAREEDDDGTP